MEYKDTILPSEEELKTLNKGYIMAQKNSLDDLSEILEKMQEEREYIRMEHLENSHKKLLNTLDNCIDNLKGILEAKGKENSRVHSHSAINNLITGENEKLDDTTANEQPSGTPNEEQNDTHKRDQIEGEQLEESATQNDDEKDLGERDLSEQNPSQSKPNARPKTQNRGRPFWQNPLAQIFSNFPLKLGKNNGRNAKKEAQNLSEQSYPQTNQKCGNMCGSNSQATMQKQAKDVYGYTQIRQGVKQNNYRNSLRPNQTLANNCGCPPSHSQESYIWNGRRPITPDCERRYPHNPPLTPDCEPFPCPPPKPFPPSPRPPQGGCDPHKKMVTNELDIIRLLLLYMALRPNCPYTYRLCTIAQEHLEILGEMVTK